MPRPAPQNKQPAPSAQRLERPVPLVPTGSDSVVTHYASILAAQPVETNMLISFFEVHPPVFFGPPEQQMAQLERTKSVAAECVARVIVSAERLEEMINILSTALELLRAKKDTKE